MGYVWCEICVGYVWCEIRQQSSEEPCDETSFGKKKFLRQSGAVGNTTRNRDVTKDMAYSDPVRNGDAVETTGYLTTLTDGKDTIKCRDILS